MRMPANQVTSSYRSGAQNGGAAYRSGAQNGGTAYRNGAQTGGVNTSSYRVSQPRAQVISSLRLIEVAFLTSNSSLWSQRTISTSFTSPNLLTLIPIPKPVWFVRPSRNRLTLNLWAWIRSKIIGVLGEVLVHLRPPCIRGNLFPLSPITPALPPQSDNLPFLFSFLFSRNYDGTLPGDNVCIR